MKKITFTLLLTSILFISCSEKNSNPIESNDIPIWSKVSSGLPAGGMDEVNSLMVSGTNLFAATDSGVFISTNNGLSWKSTFSPKIPFNTLVQSGSNIFAGTRINGIYISKNNGLDWEEVNNGLPKLVDYSNLYVEIKSLVTLDSNIFAGTIGNGIFMSTNNGKNWTEENTGLGCPVIYSLGSVGRTLVAGTLWGPYFTMNNGKSWSIDATGFSSFNFVYSLLFLGNNLFAGTSSNIFLSTNNGVNWNIK
ncbi:MAG: hypothetical protein WBV81_14140 [Ignavibacteriaceae bacterium]